MSSPPSTFLQQETAGNCKRRLVNWEKMNIAFRPRKCAILSACLLVIVATGLTSIYSAFASTLRDVNEATTIMAAVSACNVVVPQDLKRNLYSKLFDEWKSTEIINYNIDGEIKALNKFPTSDRTAMCTAIGDRIKSLAQ
jgi:hypothetical protein